MSSLWGSLRHTIDGVEAADWWSGFIGNVVGAVTAALIALVVVRRQTRSDHAILERQVEAEREARLHAAYVAATNDLLIKLQSMADRCRHYAFGPRRQAAVDERKDQNLANDCTREIMSALPSIREEDLSQVLRRVPGAFRQFSDNFGRQIEAESRGEQTPDARIWAQAVNDYIGRIVNEIFKHRQGQPIDENLRPPPIPYN